MTSRPGIPLTWLSRDARIVIIARGLHAFGMGNVSVLGAIYLHLLGFDLVQIGLFLGAGLAGAILYTLVIVLIGDRLGRRRLLAAFTFMIAGAALAMAIMDNFLLLTVVVFLGGFSMAGGPGRGGAVLPLAQAVLADTVSADKRTNLYTIYAIVGRGCTALGALAASMPALYQDFFGLSELSAVRIAFVTFAILFALSALLYNFLSPSVEVSSSRQPWVNPFRLPSRRLILTLSGLLGVDSFAGGLVVQSLISLWFFTQFGVKLESIAFIFFGSQFMSAISMWVSAWLANRLGLIRTMVFTHIPASLMLIAFPFLPTAWIAAVFWIIRSFFHMMDVPLRMSYRMAVVSPHERSSMAGVSNVTMGVAGIVSPPIATALWSIGAISIPFISGGIIKLAYDLSLYIMFRKVKPPEEAHRSDA
ncbi:MFS transporter [Chloroflexota bacterium]